jgi:hypothetical protein
VKSFKIWEVCNVSVCEGRVSVINLLSLDWIIVSHTIIHSHCFGIDVPATIIDNCLKRTMANPLLGPGVHFSCGANASLCFHPSATCETSTEGEEICHCPPDGSFIHDFTAGHFANCAMPYWFLPTVFAITTAGTLWSLYLMIPAIRESRFAMRKVAILYTMSLTFIWLHELAVLLEKGVFEAAIIFTCLVCASTCWQYYLIIMAFIEPIYAVLTRSNKRISRSLVVFFTLIVIPWAVISFAMLVYCRAAVTSPDIAIYNGLGLGLGILASSAFGVVTFTTYVQASALQRIISELTGTRSAESTTLVAVSDQLHDIKKSMLILSCNVWLILLPVVMLAIGSMPYQFVFWSFAYTIWPITPRIVGFLKARSADSQQRSTTNSYSKRNPIYSIRNAVSSLRGSTKVTAPVELTNND